MKKLDYILIALLIGISFTPYIFLRTSTGLSKNVYAEVLIDNEVVKKINISDPRNFNKPFEMETDHGHNTLLVTTDGISVSHADCPDQVCVRSKPIKKENRVIACLPNKMLIKIIDEEDSTTDNDSEHNHDDDDEIDFISE
ncbi:NusG domain II-containing protein [Oceanirhabdus sp. W0125-5]|uniref:NusG domain II-containing protein n=1 Tax=Oceanirhabdus sp. W0125-5 TaxID=2999116 RepID=UPI0022F2C7A2|nr:NusG domain II-containing protein [Oceanirhabdus sp. W0125-5]WBW99365.1 NusG domain II-containing protein [Oceanirhabdus sp. W0125-5]